ncbi:hypothetical protein L1280_001936 [Deinococcus sp. HSC-46F16]|uniref:hypothetical protein n=1 Tax=Deinococcus sp. HSC-46F16 TaxID=2910968 RepID=UPI00209CBC83|nr:hypothetical protein [Deinococcus sp. HSC-46F16]MCP2014784.1 hypothetical protein [Deinococcus sp. HSC-46F16]
MRLCWPALLTPLLLTACIHDRQDPGPPLPPSPQVEEADLIAAIDLTLKPLPTLRTAALGEPGLLRGPTSTGLPVGQSIILAARPAPDAPGTAFRLPDAGRIPTRGQAEVQLPAAPDLTRSERLTALEWARTYNSFEPCAVNTLRVDPGQEGVRLTRVDAITRNPSVRSQSQGVGDTLAGGGDLTPATSPPPSFVNVWPYRLIDTWDVTEDTGDLVYADGDVTLRGELRCVFKYVSRVEDATQYNLFVNLELRRGWNVVRRRFDAGVPRGTLKIADKLLTGGARDFTFETAASGDRQN